MVTLAPFPAGSFRITAGNLSAGSGGRPLTVAENLLPEGPHSTEVLDINHHGTNPYLVLRHELDNSTINWAMNVLVSKLSFGLDLHPTNFDAWSERTISAGDLRNPSVA